MLSGNWGTWKGKANIVGQEVPDADAEKPDQSIEVEKDHTTADTDQSAEKLFAEAVNLHQCGVQGDKKAVVKALELLTELRKLLPQNNLVEAYYGSATSLLGRDVVDPMDRFNKAIQGLKILDGAVSKEPNNTEIRTLRAFVCYRLPEMYFHRTRTAIEDFNYLISCYEQDPSIYSQDFYWTLLYNLGVSYKNLGRKNEADTTREKLLSVAGEDKYNELLAQESLKAQALSGTQEIDDGPEIDLQGKTKEEVLEEGLKLYELAIAGEKDASRNAFAFFSKAIKMDPQDLLLKAYYADCMSLTARDATEPTGMFGNSFKAMKLFDEIVNRNPANHRIRIMRANHSFRLPELFFRRTATAIADYEYLIQRYEEDHSSFDETACCQILYNLSVAYQRMNLENEASAARTKLLSLNPDPTIKALIEKEENDIKEIGQLNVSADDRKDALLEEGIRLHDLGVAGNKKAVKLALELLEKVYKADPRNAMAKGYYGSCLALNARDSMDTNILFGDTIKGLKLLNSALAKDWNNPRLRLLRGYFTFSLPESFFHLTGRALKDFRFLKTAYEADNSIFSKELYHQILYDLGMAYERTGNDVKAQKTRAILMNVSHDPKYLELLTRKGVYQDELPV